MTSDLCEHTAEKRLCGFYSDYFVFRCLFLCRRDLACMSKTLYFPVTVVCAYDLGVARDDVEGCFCLGTVELRYEVE